jgi:DNA-binding NarL/FixJ family response regulator
VITVLIADDQHLMRAALRTCLTAEPDIVVVAEAIDGLEAVALATRLRPDVVLMDIRMPNLDGIAATRQLTAANTDKPTRVIAITTFNLDEYVGEVLCAGASGFLLKDTPTQELVDAVRVIAAGGLQASPDSSW